MQKSVARALAGLMVLAVIGLAVSLVLYRASQQVPEFYRRALSATNDIETSERFERQALSLHNQVRHVGHWETRFSEDEINAWLAALPEKFPQLLAGGISDPRISLEGNLVRLAVRYQRGATTTVVSLAALVHLTDEPNELAVEIREARAGALPVPLARFLDEIKLHAAQADLAVRWTEAAGHPVALVRLPLEAKGSSARQIRIERLTLDDRAMVVGGRTEEFPQAPAIAGRPNQPGAELAPPPVSEIRQR